LAMAAEPEIRRIVLQDARAVLGHGGAAAQEQCTASLGALLQALMAQGAIRACCSRACAGPDRNHRRRGRHSRQTPSSRIMQHCV
ncbi:MAG: hypothetical protein KBO59_16950, partial [Achromobacter sp.]|nr:hypothetical protein [Achromobacter sp.]